MHYSLRRRAQLMLVCVLAIRCASRVGAQDESAEQANRALAVAFETAWNHHDMHAFGSMLTVDADWVNVAGMHWRGREEIEREHAARHASPVFKDSVWSTQHVYVALVKPDLALVHIDWAIRGDRDPDGTPRQPREGVLTLVTIKDDVAWRIRAGHNTNKR